MTLMKRFLAEFLGTAGLLIVVVGSGIMGETGVHRLHLLLTQRLQ